MMGAPKTSASRSLVDRLAADFPGLQCLLSALRTLSAGAERAMDARSRTLLASRVRSFLMRV
jgi:hypothetical protein